MKHFFILLIIFVVYTSSLFSQIIYENRIEIELRDGYIDETVYESRNGNFIFEATAKEKVNNHKEIRYDLYDGDLKLLKSESILIPSAMKWEELYYNDSAVYNLYKNRKTEYLILGVSTKDLSIVRVEGELPRKMKISDMKILGDHAFFLSSIKRAPFIYSVDLNSKKATSIPIIAGSYQPKKLNVLNYQINEKLQEIFVFISAKINKREYELFLMTIFPDGSTERVVKIIDNEEYNIINASASRVSENKIIVSGTYSKTKRSSEGLFFSEIENGTMNYIQYYNFLEMKDFLSYLPERKQEKIEKKKSKKEKKGKELSYSYNIADHDIMILEDGYLFLGEAYYPTYRTETYVTYTTINGITTPQMQYRQVFDGYYYTHAVLTKFDMEGNLLWDICFEMRPRSKPFYVKRFIAVSEQTENVINMFFSSSNRLTYKSVDFDGNVIQDDNWEILETGKDGDKSKWASSNIDYWYKNYFITYGRQKIKNKSNSEDRGKRIVYYINKIGIETETTLE